jgi:hypothetical protein
VRSDWRAFGASTSPSCCHDWQRVAEQEPLAGLQSCHPSRRGWLSRGFAKCESLQGGMSVVHSEVVAYSGSAGCLRRAKHDKWAHSAVARPGSAMHQHTNRHQEGGEGV